MLYVTGGIRQELWGCNWQNHSLQSYYGGFGPFSFPRLLVNCPEALELNIASWKDSRVSFEDLLFLNLLFFLRHSPTIHFPRTSAQSRSRKNVFYYS